MQTRNVFEYTLYKKKSELTRQMFDVVVSNTQQ